jgi:hypothetical protein
MSDKTLLSNAELELTQKMQMHFPRGVIPTEVIKELNGLRVEDLSSRLQRFILNRGRMQVLTTSGIVAPPNGIVRMFTVLVNESRPLKEVVHVAFPDTPKDHSIWGVGDQYPPLAGAIERLEEVFIVNFGKYSLTPSQTAIEWGKKQRLVSASPRACFAIAEHLPKLNTYLEMDPMAILSLRECSFEGEQACWDAWFDGSERGARLNQFEAVWLGFYWFAFVRELESGGILGS